MNQYEMNRMSSHWNLTAINDDLQCGVLLVGVNGGEVIQRRAHGTVGPLSDLAGQMSAPLKLPLYDVLKQLVNK